MSRKRVIVDIENLEQALRLEQTVRTGYCDAVTENLLAWVAVEEDLATSYEKLSGKFSELELREVMKQLSEASTNNVDQLQGLLNVVSQFSAAGIERERMIENLISRKSDKNK